MIKITAGKGGKSLADLAEAHWTYINPRYQNRKKVYQKTGALAGRFEAYVARKVLNGEADLAAFFSEFCQNDFVLLQACIKAPATSFGAIISHVNTLLIKHNLDEETLRREVMSSMGILFNYDNWRTNGGGYDLFVELEIKVCVYCNTEDLKNDIVNKKFIGTYDHYYDKAIYPYLNLALGNLIPSCYACNQTYKKTFFCTSTHIHPHIDDYNQLCTFISDYTGDMDAPHKVWIQPNINPDDKRLLLDTDLSLDTRYNDEPVLKQVVSVRGVIDSHPPERINDISVDLGLSVQSAVEHVCRTYDIPVQPIGILSSVYGKLKRDLALQHHLIH